jgi:hypothetical protein
MMNRHCGTDPASLESTSSSSGASVIDCWWTSRNSLAWDNLRHNLSPPVLAPPRSAIPQESQLSNTHCHASRKGDFRRIVRHGFYKNSKSTGGVELKQISTGSSNQRPSINCSVSHFYRMCVASPSASGWELHSTAYCRRLYSEKSHHQRNIRHPARPLINPHARAVRSVLEPTAEAADCGTHGLGARRMLSEVCRCRVRSSFGKAHSSDSSEGTSG